VTDSADDLAGHRTRLRQRLFEGGDKALLDHELVEYLLGLAIPRRDTKKEAKALIAKFGGLGPLLGADADTLRKEGLTEGMVGALKIAEASARRLLETRVEGRPILSSWDALGDYLQAAMAHSPVEEVRVLFLNAKNMLLANEAMWQSMRPPFTSGRSSAAPSSLARRLSSLFTTTRRAIRLQAARISA
jgi:DNA repair protein RadC